MDSDSDSTVLWERRFAELGVWKAAHGNCNVPKAEGKLGRWVVRQRELQKKAKLEPERRVQLDSLGFVWNTNEAAWEHRYALLCRYAEEHGHCCVPISDPALGMWVAKMRANRRRNKLSQGRIDKLNAISFVWNTAEADWMDKYNKLLDFRVTNDHACVPFNEGELGWWVNTQRQSKRKGKLAKHREQLLNDADFIWNPQEFLAARRRKVAAAKAKSHSICGEGLISPPSSQPRRGSKRGTTMRERPATSVFMDDRAAVDSASSTLALLSSSPLSSCKRRKITTASQLQTPATLPLSAPSTPNTGLSTIAAPEPRLWTTHLLNSAPSYTTAPRSPSQDMSSQNSRGAFAAPSEKIRCDVQSIASLLSPSPAVSTADHLTSHSLPLPSKRLEYPTDFTHAFIPCLPSSMTGLASLHSSRTGWGQRSSSPTAKRSFVLPPISCLQALGSAQISHH